MPRNPHMVSIPVSLLDDRRLSARDQATLMHLIELANNSAHCDYDEHTLTHLLGVTTRTARKWLARLEGFGYIINHKDWVELHDDLVLTDDSLLMADLPPLSDEEFAQLQLADDPGEFLKEYAGRKLFVDLPPRPHRETPPPQAVLREAERIKFPRAHTAGSATTRATGHWWVLGRDRPLPRRPDTDAGGPVVDVADTRRQAGKAGRCRSTTREL